MSQIGLVENFIINKGPEIMMLPTLILQTLGGNCGILKTQEVSYFIYITLAVCMVVPSVFVIFINIDGLRAESNNIHLISLWIMTFFYRNGSTVLFFVLLFKSLRRATSEQYFGHIAKEVFSTHAAIRKYKNMRLTKYIALTTGCTFAILSNFLYTLHTSHTMFGSRQNIYRDLQIFIPQVLAECEMVICATLVIIISECFDDTSNHISTKCTVPSVIICNNTIEQLRAMPTTVPRIDNINDLICIDKACDVYRKIGTVLDRVKRYFRLQILLYMNYVFWFEILSLALEVLILMQWEKGNPLNLSFGKAMRSAWNLSRMFIVFFFLCWSCERLYAKVDCLKAAIIHIGIRSTNLETRRRCRRTLDVMNLNPVNITVYRMFRVDLRLVVLYLGLITSYMVVILQFYL